MCDERTEAENRIWLASNATSRRGFGAIMGAAGVAVLLPTAAHGERAGPDNAPEPTFAGRDVEIPTPEGIAQAYFTAPAEGKYPAVLIWPDIMGLRPAFRSMADRLAADGYAVLVVNQFYRSARAPVLAAGEAFAQPAVRDRLISYARAITPAGTASDATAFIAWLDAQPQTDTRRGVGTTGYCMGGPMAFRTATAVSDRVRAVGTFHGGGLVTDAPDSPHRGLAESHAAYLVAIAANDDKASPGDKDVLRTAFAAAGRPAEVEVYPGTMHGWCPPDTKVYDHDQAERAWARLQTLLESALVAG